MTLGLCTIMAFVVYGAIIQVGYIYRARRFCWAFSIWFYCCVPEEEGQQGNRQDRVLEDHDECWRDT